MSTDMSTVGSLFAKNAQMLERATQGIPAEKWLTQPTDNSNHLLWIAGHMAVHRAKVLNLLGEAWTDPWGKLFVRGATLAAPEAYPAVEEVQRTWADVCQRVSAALARASAETLAKPSQPPTPSFDGTLGGTIAFLAFHETYHVGQVGYLRKALGFGQTVG
jgi:uncharacterized damage-inducible protein DinB